MRSYRWFFALAALHNLAFGLWAGFWPGSFFTLFELPPPRYPSIWACLGMVVGLYGLVYAYVAWRPKQGMVLVGIGLLGKVLGPLGWLSAVGAGELPPRTFPLVLCNDLVWWFPFLFYLLRKVRSRVLLISLAVVVVHFFACVALLLCAGGTEIVDDVAARQQWIRGHVPLWTATWLLWALSSLSLIAFLVLWTGTLLRLGASRLVVMIGSAVACAGLPCDLVGESISLTGADAEARPTPEAFATAARLYAWLSPGLANGLYCAGGMILSMLSWRIGWLRGWRGLMGLTMWGDGLLLTVAVILDWPVAMLVTGAVVMLLFVPWAMVVGLVLDRHCRGAIS